MITIGTESGSTTMTGTITDSEETITLTATELAEIALSMAVALTKTMAVTIIAEVMKGDSEIRKAAMAMVKEAILAEKGATETAVRGNKDF
jgi:hypothetical protein